VDASSVLANWCVECVCSYVVRLLLGFQFLGKVQFPVLR
jgi:hypothetical protein